jgi:hypothetical protein
MTSFVGSKSRSLIVFFALFSVILSFFLFDVAFRELSFLKTHFWPFTEVMRRIRPEVTKERRTNERPIIINTTTNEVRVFWRPLMSEA